MNDKGKSPMPDWNQRLPRDACGSTNKEGSVIFGVDMKQSSSDDKGKNDDNKNGKLVIFGVDIMNGNNDKSRKNNNNEKGGLMIFGVDMKEGNGSIKGKKNDNNKGGLVIFGVDMMEINNDDKGENKIDTGGLAISGIDKKEISIKKEKNKDNNKGSLAIFGVDTKDYSNDNNGKNKNNDSNLPFYFSSSSSFPMPLTSKSSVKLESGQDVASSYVLVGCTNCLHYILTPKEKRECPLCKGTTLVHPPKNAGKGSTTKVSKS